MEGRKWKKAKMEDRKSVACLIVSIKGGIEKGWMVNPSNTITLKFGDWRISVTIIKPLCKF